MSRPSYREVKAQIAALQAKAIEIRKVEAAEAIATIRQLMDEYELTVDDIAPKGRGGRAAKVQREAKYRDPASGKTWTGSGRQPRWISAAIKSGAALDEFLVAKPAVAKSPAAAPTGAKPRATRKAKAAPEKKAPAVRKPASKAAPARGSRRAPKNAKPATADAVSEISSAATASGTSGSPA